MMASGIIGHDWCAEGFVQRIREGLKIRLRSLVTQRTGLDEMAVDDLATSTKLQSWEAVQIPERLDRKSVV